MSKEEMLNCQQIPAGLESNARQHLNKGKVYISRSSPRSVLDAYSLQFQNDFSLFIKSRSEELVPGGRMVLSFMGRGSDDPTTQDSCYHWELLAQAIMTLVREVNKHTHTLLKSFSLISRLIDNYYSQ